MSQEPRVYHIDAVERALQLLESLASRPDVSLVELAEQLGAPKGSLFRHLKVLERWGYVRQSPTTKRFDLGPRLIYLGFEARESLVLPQVAGPHMVQLRDRFNETVHVGVLSSGEVVHVAAVASTHPVKMDTAVGDRTGAHISALGKAILGSSPDDVVDQVIAERGLPRATSHTITTKSGLLADLKTVRDRGYAIDNEESLVGLRCVAAPIRDEQGGVIGAISVSSPADRLSLEEAHRAGPILIETADQVSAHFGWKAAPQLGR